MPHPGRIALVLLALIGGCRRSPPTLVSVTARAPGRTAPEVERALAIPLETGLAGAPSSTGSRARSIAGAATVTVRFAPGIDRATAERAVLDRLPSIALPDGVHAALAPDGAIALRVAFGSEVLPLAQVTELLERLVRPELLHVAGVAAIERCGAEPPRIEVRLDPHLLSAVGVPYPAIRRAIAGAAATVEALGALVVATRNGAPIRLTDLATITVAGPPPDCLCLLDGRPTVEVIIRAWSGADQAKLRAAVQERLAHLALPAGLTIVPIDAPPIRLRAAPPPTETSDRWRLLRRVSDLLRRDPAPSSILIELGRSDDNALEISIAAPVERAPDLAARLAELPDLGTILVEPGAPITSLAIVGPDRDALDRIARDLRDRVPESRLLRVDGAAPRLEAAIDPVACARVGVPVAEVEALAASALAGDPIGEVTLYLGSIAGGPSAGGSAIEQLAQVFVALPDGKQLPLGQLASFRLAAPPAILTRSDGQRSLELAIQRGAGIDEQTLARQIAALPLPAGYSIQHR